MLCVIGVYESVAVCVAACVALSVAVYVAVYVLGGPRVVGVDPYCVPFVCRRVLQGVLQCVLQIKRVVSRFGRVMSHM